MNNFSLVYNAIRGKNITLDCNVFILLVVGSIGKEHILKCKRTNSFSIKDFDILIRLIKDSKITLTPSIVSETSDLLESYSYNNQRIGLISISNLLQRSIEIYTTSLELSKHNSFFKFGISDTSIFELCTKGIMAITTDLDLYGFLSQKALPVINFNHFRTNFN